LVPLDGSELAAKVIPQAEELARAFNAQLVLMTVGSAMVGEIGASSREAGSEAVARMPAVSYLEETAAALLAKSLDATWVFKQGAPAREIIDFAAAHQMALIVMASHGAGEIAWLLGSVAQKVVSHAPAPVLLVRVMMPKPPEHKAELDYFPCSPLIRPSRSNFCNKISRGWD
jgi:nucleotide-binding universal stress UspA family protein